MDTMANRCRRHSNAGILNIVAKPIFFRFAAALGVLLFSHTSFGADPEIAPQLYEQVRASVFQIRVIERASGNKSSTGSGFPVGDGGLIATNYHVVSSVVLKGKKYRAQVIDHQDLIHDARVVAVDVVHDLALIRADDLVTEPLPIAAEEPKKGATVYSLGFPFDVGITLVPGTHNGMIDHSAYGRLHFSGALNPGMSGGPALDARGHVIGVNVATAGNQLSFLVPASALRAFTAREHPDGKDAIKRSIGDQLRANGRRLLREVIDGDWNTEPVGQGFALGEFTDYVRCWGSSNSDDKEARHLVVARHCRVDDEIYMSHSLRTGRIGLEYFWLESDELNRWQFYSYYEQLFSSFVSDNRVDEEDVGNYDCRTRFVADESHTGDAGKAIYCVRAYRDYDDLFDVLYARGSIDRKDRAYVAHYTLAGVPRDIALEFNAKFMESSAWLSSK